MTSKIYYHVMTFWVTKDGYPEMDYLATYDEGTAYEHAAFSVKGTTPRGFVIMKREGSGTEVLECYRPYGGPERFTMEKDSHDNAHILFDGFRLT